MDTIAVFVGWDHHQSGVQICVLDEAGRMLANGKSVNEATAVISQVQRFGTVRRAAVEACSGAADFAEELVRRAGWAVDMAHPGYVARMKLNPDKTDYSDARMLAELVRTGFLPKVWLAPREVRELRLLVRLRQQRVNEARATKLRIGAVLREPRCLGAPAARWTRSWLEWLHEEAPLSEQGRWTVRMQLQTLKRLKEEIAEVEARLREVTGEDRLVRRLLEEPGIGPVTAWMLRAEIGRFERFHNGKQWARFCGLRACEFIGFPSENGRANH